MTKIRKQSLVDQIYSLLRESILTLRYPLGSRVNVNEIQQEYGVSSTPLREALNRLQQEGLVTTQTNVGASVLPLAPHDVEEIEEVAFALQTAAVFSLAGTKATSISLRDSSSIHREAASSVRDSSVPGYSRR